MKKTIVVLVLIFLFSSISNSQIYKGFGVKLGTSIARQTDAPYFTVPSLKIKFGFSAGIFKEIHLIDKLNLVTGINYVQKGALMEFINTNELGQDLGKDYIHRNVNFVNLEVLGKFNLNTGIYYPYILAGLRMDVLASSNNTLNGSELDYNVYGSPINNNKTFGGIIGLGFEYKPSKLFTLLLEGTYNPDFTYLGEHIDSEGFPAYLKSNSFDIRTGIKF